MNTLGNRNWKLRDYKLRLYLPSQHNLFSILALATPLFPLLLFLSPALHLTEGKGDGAWSCCERETAEQTLHSRTFAGFPSSTWVIGSALYFCVYFKVIESQSFPRCHHSVTKKAARQQACHEVNLWPKDTVPVTWTHLAQRLNYLHSV